MANLNIGDPAPYFKLYDQDRNFRTLEDFKGQWLVLYFYPKDDTPGCCAEAIGFTNIFEEFQELDAQIVGISGDSVQSHREFIDKYNLKVTLLSDEIHSVIKEYGAHTFKGSHVSRDTILIDPSGNIAFIWRVVNPADHPTEVKAKLAELKE
ncbi:MAG TPA: peroxiredoxin [Candidatus Lokiarchaeia archaeon]|nr:peroxiredoxin [Candidatus Lokiarchaeia archaeon]